MNKIKIKICGITKKEDAFYASKLGAWAVGFVFVENTPRYIPPKKAAEIIKKLPANIEKIGVFANIPEKEIKKIVNQSGLTKIQLHGSETAQFCENLAKITEKDIIKAIRIKSAEDLQIISSYKEKASFILLDSYSKNELGGTGNTFDWEIAINAKKYNIPLILAGGLNPNNAKIAYDTVKPYALDISSGVESNKGIKDFEKLERLFLSEKHPT